MKINFHFWLFIIFLAAPTLLSCTKENALNTPPPIMPPAPPAAKEYILDSLTWQFYASGYPEWDEVYLVSASRPDLLWNESWFLQNANISVKSDTATSWTPARYIDVAPQSSGSPYYWYFSPEMRLVITVFPLQRVIVGKRGAIRVRFP